MVLKLVHRYFPYISYIMENTWVKDHLISVLKTGRLPHHVGFIMDGNRRFAKEKGLAPKEGHKAGAKALMDTLETCFALGIKEVSVYAFSIENFKRPKEEVDEIHRLIRDNVCKIIETDVIEKHRVRINFVGNRALIAPDILSDFERFEEKTNTAEATNILNICFAYTARDEIAHSVQQVAAKREAQVLAKSDICESHITENLYVGTSGSPLDLLVRTSGETRLSDFLLWQCTASCQIVYLDVLWPRMSFLDLYLLFLGWSYSQIMVHDRRITWALPKSTASVQLRMLPASPPFASVTGEKK